MKKKWLIISSIIYIFIFLVSYGLNSWYYELEVKNKQRTPLEYVTLKSEQNISYDVDTTNLIILKLGEDKEYNYYLYMKSATSSNNMVVYMTDEDMIKLEEGKSIEGSLRRITDEIKEEILNEYKVTYGSIKEKEFERTFSNYYIDTSSFIIESTILRFTLFLLTFITSILGILINIFFIIKNNFDYIKKNLSKIILIITFIPYALLIIYAIYSAFTGVGFMDSTTYGIDAFFTALFLLTIIFFSYIPILPICIVYQLSYFVIKLNKKKKTKKNQKRKYKRKK